VIFPIAEQTTPSVGFTEVLEIAGLCAIVMSALLVPMWAYARRSRKRLMELEAAWGSNSGGDRLYRKLVAETVARGFVGASNSLEFIAGIIERIVNNRLKEIDGQKALGKLGHHRAEVERAWMELRLLTGDRAEKTSALQQLAQIGDERTFQSLQLQLADEDFSGSEREQVERAAREIRQRVDAVNKL
jgi:hypothetical protein